MRLAPAILLTAVVLGGCGNERQPTPDVRSPGPPLGSAPASYPAAGLLFRSPGGWNRDPGTAPLIATVATGEATIAIYRYPRTEPLPHTRKELDVAVEALAGAAKTRDATFTELKRARVRVDGKPGVQLRGTETVNGRVRTVRSTHVYAAGGEVVVDAFAPAESFKRVDAETFRPLLRSMKIATPKG